MRKSSLTTRRKARICATASSRLLMVPRFCSTLRPSEAWPPLWSVRRERNCSLDWELDWDEDGEGWCVWEQTRPKRVQKQMQRWKKATTKWTETPNVSSSSSVHANAHEYSPRMRMPSNANAHAHAHAHTPAQAQAHVGIPYRHPALLGLHLRMSRNRQIWLRPLHQHRHGRRLS